MAKIRTVEAILDLSGVDDKYKPLFKRSVEDLVKVLESSHWDDAWVKLYKTSNKWEGELNDKLKKYTPAQAALILFNRTPVKTVNGKKVYTIKLDLNTYYTAKRVIGYGVGSNDEIFVNTKYLSAYTVSDSSDRKAVSSNLSHEEAHNCGCDHDFNSTAKRPHSLAYLHNDALEIAWDIVFKKGNVEVDMTEVIKPIADLPTPAPIPETPDSPIEVTPKDPTVPLEVITNPKPETAKRVCYKPWWGFGLITRCYNEEI